ncbi:hypothetical protein Droror1_Dr00026698 [Drosera rotundifolia]
MQLGFLDCCLWVKKSIVEEPSCWKHVDEAQLLEVDVELKEDGSSSGVKRQRRNSPIVSKEISEVVNNMEDLIDYSRITGTGPMGKDPIELPISCFLHLTLVCMMYTIFTYELKQRASLESASRCTLFSLLSHKHALCVCHCYIVTSNLLLTS